jgi:hypothetical protein
MELAVIRVGVGSRMNHDIGIDTVQGGSYLVLIGDVSVGSGERHEIVLSAKNFDDSRSEQSIRAGYRDSHCIIST